MSGPQGLPELLHELRLPTIADDHQDVAIIAEREGWSFVQYLRALVDVELEGRRTRRIQRQLKESGLPVEKSRATLRLERLSIHVRRQVATLYESEFANRAENVLIFGLPGRGKTHLACAIGHELLHHGHRVLFMPAYQLVQRLLVAKRELRLEKLIAQLDKYDVVIADDIGYVKQDRAEMEVLFTFLAARYERRSVIITSNLVFSEWEKIFHDPMTTAAAIDRLVHHATIVEMGGGSVREEEAKERQLAEADVS